MTCRTAHAFPPIYKNSVSVPTLFLYYLSIYPDLVFYFLFSDSFKLVYLHFDELEYYHLCLLTFYYQKAVAHRPSPYLATCHTIGCQQMGHSGARHHHFSDVFYCHNY